MVCIYCGHKTNVTNSRAQKRLRQTWRRRQCISCNAVFTTHELVDLSASVVVRHNTGAVQPFSRDILFMSILQAVGHRKAPVLDAGALTATVISILVPTISNASISPADIATSTHQVLQNFDTAAAVQYQAYHPSIKN